MSLFCLKLPAPITAKLPERRENRPMRRDRGGFTPPASNVLWRDAVIDVLKKHKFPDERHEDIIGNVHDALSFREHDPPSLARDADETEDLAELYIRIEDVLDSLDAMANKTYSRIFDELRRAGSGVNPHELNKQLKELLWGVRHALASIPPGKDRRGRHSYDDTRETPLLAALVATWFEHFPGDDGVKRYGDYVARGYREYEGPLLDFLVAMYQAVEVNAGSAAAIGRRLFDKTFRAPDGSKTSLQDRIRATFLAVTAE